MVFNKMLQTLFKYIAMQFGSNTGLLLCANKNRDRISTINNEQCSLRSYLSLKMFIERVYSVLFIVLLEGRRVSKK